VREIRSPGSVRGAARKGRPYRDPPRDVDGAGRWVGRRVLSASGVGGLFDAETGLVRFGARDYDPRVGRWTARDPVRFEGGRNGYIYLSASPLLGRDPSGLACWKETINFALCAVAAAACVGDPSHFTCFGAGVSCYRATVDLQKCEEREHPADPPEDPYCRPGASPGPDSGFCKRQCEP
jgi:RHS repeat-associated protein